MGVVEYSLPKLHPSTLATTIKIPSIGLSTFCSNFQPLFFEQFPQNLPVIPAYFSIITNISHSTLTDY